MSSSDVAISVRGVSKAYTIRHQEEHHITLAEQLLHRARHPLSRQERETFWALEDVELRRAQGRGARRDRPQRRGQEHAAEGPVADHATDQGRGAALRARREPARGRHRLPSRADRPRERLSQRRDPRDADQGDRSPLRRDRRRSPASRSSSTRR